MSEATFDQANLQVKLYDLRREPRLREAREWFSDRFHPQSLDDVKTVGKPLPGFTQPRLAPQVVQLHLQICLVERCFTHGSSLRLTAGKFLGVAFEPQSCEERCHAAGR